MNIDVSNEIRGEKYVKIMISRACFDFEWMIWLKIRQMSPRVPYASAEMYVHFSMNHKQLFFRTVICCIWCPFWYSATFLIYIYNETFHLNILSKLFTFADDTKYLFRRVIFRLTGITERC